MLQPAEEEEIIVAYDDHPAIADTKNMRWYGDDENFTTNLKREFVRWDPTRRATTVRQTADIISPDDGTTFKQKAQLLNLRRDLDDLDRQLRWAGR